MALPIGILKSAATMPRTGGFDLAGAGTAAGGLLGAIGNIIPLFRDVDVGREIPTLQLAADQAAAQAAYSQALAQGPGNRYFDALSQIYEQEGVNEFLRAIEDVSRANRRARARGAIGIGINPERADEARLSALARMRPQAGIIGREVASRQLERAAGTAGQAGQTAALGFPAFREAALRQREREVSRFPAIGDVIAGVGRLANIFTQGGQPQGASPIQGVYPARGYPSVRGYYG